MRKSFAIIWLAVLTALGAVAAKTISYEEPVTTVVFDNDTSGSPLLVRSDDYNGGGQATYTTVNGNGRTVEILSQIASDGGWKLDLHNQSIRTLFITPNDAINSSQPAAPPAGDYFGQIVVAHSHCFDSSNNVVPFQGLVNGSNNCGFQINFLYGGTQYALAMNPKINPTCVGCNPGPGPVTGLASVGCNAVSSGNCVSWTITPNMIAPNATVANLYEFGSKGFVFVGQYYNTYRVNVMNP
ncbi:MAG TPA: hypothetical protein VG498_15180 [Terriglobales bacterium]|nr:hypothetical protein [Terriglobales bacterium]